MNLRYRSLKQHKSSGTTNNRAGIPACKKHISIIVHNIIAITLICVGRGRGGRWGEGCAIDGHKVAKIARESTVTRRMTQMRAIPVTVCSDERPGLALGLGEVHTMGCLGEGGALTRRRGTI